MRVAIATARVPFSRSASDTLAAALQGALQASGHEAEIVAFPFTPSSATVIPDQMLACRLMQAAESSGVAIDRLIGLAFPATLIPHPAKRLWLDGLYSPAYDGWDAGTGGLRDAPGGAHARHAIHAADAAALAESDIVYTVSGGASAQLRAYAGVVATPLYHPPPNADRLAHAEPDDYVLLPDANLTDAWHGPVLDALACTRAPVRACFLGAFATAADEAAIMQRARLFELQGRLRWHGPASEAGRVDLFSHCLAVVVVDPRVGYGYGTLEAMLSSKPVVADARVPGTTEFVADGQTGFVCEPGPAALAVALDRLWADRARAVSLGRAGRDHYADLRPGWDRVIECLLG